MPITAKDAEPSINNSASKIAMIQKFDKSLDSQAASTLRGVKKTMDGIDSAALPPEIKKAYEAFSTELEKKDPNSERVIKLHGALKSATTQNTLSFPFSSDESITVPVFKKMEMLNYKMDNYIDIQKQKTKNHEDIDKLRNKQSNVSGDDKMQGLAAKADVKLPGAQLTESTPEGTNLPSLAEAGAKPLQVAANLAAAKVNQI